MRTRIFVLLLLVGSIAQAQKPVPAIYAEMYGVSITNEGEASVSFLFAGDYSGRGFTVLDIEVGWYLLTPSGGLFAIDAILTMGMASITTRLRLLEGDGELNAEGVFLLFDPTVDKGRVWPPQSPRMGELKNRQLQLLTVRAIIRNQEINNKQ